MAKLRGIMAIQYLARLNEVKQLVTVESRSRGIQIPEGMVEITRDAFDCFIESLPEPTPELDVLKSILERLEALESATHIT